MTTKYEFEWVVLEETWEAHERNQGGFRLSYGYKGLPPFNLFWGTLTFFRDNKGNLKCDNERMDLEFVEQALLHFARKATLIN